MNRVSRTTPPTFGAEMEFEIAGCEQTDGDEEDEQQKQFGNEQ